MFPCAGVPAGVEGSNRTEWPLDGGSLRLNISHNWDYHFYNLGLGENVSNFNISLTHGLVNVTGRGVLCVPKLGLPADIEVKDGDLASLQVVTVGHSGSALYNCADIVFRNSAETLGSDECVSDPGVTSHVVGDSEHTDGHDDTGGNGGGADSNGLRPPLPVVRPVL
ncbi:hypothetical protein GE09DRAFT_277988 [Coniochaeta sp. 2T2.1]|nr:hypothetical protein GE09DRAFT_277988 [Coniochaeta sp. 2T2.1]